MPKTNAAANEIGRDASPLRAGREWNITAPRHLRRLLGEVAGQIAARIIARREKERRLRIRAIACWRACPAILLLAAAALPAGSTRTFGKTEPAAPKNQATLRLHEGSRGIPATSAR